MTAASALSTELLTELDRRFIARRGWQHDDQWLFDQEWALLLGVVLTAGIAVASRRRRRR